MKNVFLLHQWIQPKFLLIRPGEIVTLTATPDSGKTFNGWSCSAHCGTNSFTSSLTIEVILDFDTIDISASFN